MIRLRVLLACEVILVLAVVGLWLASRRVRQTASLFMFFLYGLPCEFLVSVAPHEPAVLYVARFHDPLIVALVAGAGTLVAEAMNYEILRHAGATDVPGRLSRAPMVRWVVDTFGRAPFAALWIAGFVPIIPFTPLRALVLLRRYPRGRYLAASVSSRTARFYVVALAGKVIRLPLTALVMLFVALLLAATLPGAYRFLTRGNTAGLDDRAAASSSGRSQVRPPERTR